MKSPALPAHPAFQGLADTAAALARRGVLLAGWLWLGWQGMHLGWPLAGGLGVVALWWALRLLCSHWASAAGRLRGGGWPLGAATCAGVLLVQGAELGQAGLPVLLATAVAWALWCAALALPAQPGGQRHPHARTGQGSPAAGQARTSAGLTQGTALAVALLPGTAMGLMMGTLWLSSQWCASAGWPASTWMTLHVALMALLPVLLRGTAQALQAQPVWRDALPLALLALGGACVLAGTSPTGWMLGMALQALAWTLGHAARPGTSPAVDLTTTPTNTTAWAPGRPLACAAALGGPLLLGLVGTLSPTTGPQALHQAQALLGALALLGLLPLLWRGRRAALSLQTPHFTHPDAP